jgi:hypothetical protein
MKAVPLTVLLAGLLAPLAAADTVEVTVTGTVGFNVIGGSHTGIPAGAPVTMRFRLDSEVFVDSPSFPTRGYPVDPDSFEMTVDGASVILGDPRPIAPASFVIRNDDPMVDGFLLSTNIDLPFPVQVFIPGLAPEHDLEFLVTYPMTTVPSLDLLDAVGSYDFTGISVFNWTIGRLGGIGAEYIYEGMTIAVVQGGGCNDADLAEPLGVLDLADVQAFIAGFTGQDPIADLAPPAGVFDLADLQAFVGAFLAGCP